MITPPDPFLFCAVSSKVADVATQYGNHVCTITLCVSMQQHAETLNLH